MTLKIIYKSKQVKKKILSHLGKKNKYNVGSMNLLLHIADKKRSLFS